jgi:signal transduction histidine kinase
MVRITSKTKICLFLQMNDREELGVRAADGLALENTSALAIKLAGGPLAQCFSKNKIVETQAAARLGALGALLRPYLKKGEKFVLAPVSGESRVLGILLVGPFPKKMKILPREAELRSAGALCAVLSAHWRMYEWMSNFVPYLNHDLRTPLTAVQGSIGLVLGGVFGQMGPDVKDMLELAQKGCERTVRAIEGYINTQTPPESGHQSIKRSGD